MNLKKALCAYWLMAAYCSVQAWILQKADWTFLQLQGKWVNFMKMLLLDATSSIACVQPGITSRLSESTPGQQGASLRSLIRRLNFRKSTSLKQCNFCGARCLGSTCGCFEGFCPITPRPVNPASRQRGVGKHGDDALASEHQTEVFPRDSHKPRLAPKSSIRVHDDSRLR